MERSEGVIAAIEGHRIVFDDGEVIETGPLSIAEATRLLRILDMAQSLSPDASPAEVAEAQYQVLEQLPDALGIPKDAPITPSEMFTVADHFLRRRNRLTPAAPAKTTTQGAQSDGSGSMT